MKETPAKLHFHYESMKGKQWVREIEMPLKFRIGTPGAFRYASTIIYGAILRESKRRPKPETVYVVLEISGEWRTIYAKSEVRRIIKT